MFLPVLLEILRSNDKYKEVTEATDKVQKYINLQLPVFFLTNLPHLIYIQDRFDSLKRCAVEHVYPEAQTFKEMPLLFKQKGVSFFFFILFLNFQ